MDDCQLSNHDPDAFSIISILNHALSFACNVFQLRHRSLPVVRSINRPYWITTLLECLGIFTAVLWALYRTFTGSEYHDLSLHISAKRVPATRGQWNADTDYITVALKLKKGPKGRVAIQRVVCEAIPTDPKTPLDEQLARSMSEIDLSTWTDAFWLKKMHKARFDPGFDTGTVELGASSLRTLSGALYLVPGDESEYGAVRLVQSGVCYTIRVVIVGVRTFLLWPVAFLSWPQWTASRAVLPLSKSV